MIQDSLSNLIYTIPALSKSEMVSFIFTKSCFKDTLLSAVLGRVPFAVLLLHTCIPHAAIQLFPHIGFSQSLRYIQRVGWTWPWIDSLSRQKMIWILFLFLYHTDNESYVAYKSLKKNGYQCFRIDYIVCILVSLWKQISILQQYNHTAYNCKQATQKA